jgi:hypothetical protein
VFFGWKFGAQAPIAFLLPQREKQGEGIRNLPNRARETEVGALNYSSPIAMGKE